MPKRTVSLGDSAGLAVAIVVKPWQRGAEFASSARSLWLAEQPSAQNANRTGNLDFTTCSSNELSVNLMMVFGKVMGASRVVKKHGLRAATRSHHGFTADHTVTGLDSDLRGQRKI